MSAPLLSPRRYGPEVTGLRVDGLTRSGEAPLLQAGFDARTGELTVLISSDTSASALLRAAVGIDPVERGESRLGGLRLARHRERSNGLGPAQIGYVGRLSTGESGQSVAEQLGEWLGHLGPARRQARVDRVSESLGFSGVGTGLVDSLPAALRHRVAIGRALAPGPGMLAIDNPFAGLERRERMMLEGLLRVVAADYDVAVVYATGATESATRAHHVVQVHGGRITGELIGWPEIQRAYGH